jgi:hypothetical protein
MVQHMLPKGFHRMRSYGLHAPCKAKKVQGVLTAFMGALGRLIKGPYRMGAQKTSRTRVLASTGRDPLPVYAVWRGDDPVAGVAPTLRRGL